MAAFNHMTRAEQRLEQLEAKRELTDAESDELRRSLHAVYVRDHRLAELELLGIMRRELAAAQREHGR
ncbi:MAG: hypothetical protein H0W71_09490 [Sphingomonas sp.]|nr:hypothetical protein [Sphingomonas sp.]